MLGQVDQIVMQNPTRPRMGKKQLGLYAQDTWKVTRRFTLDYGLRYDYSSYLRETYGRAPEFSPTTLHPALGIPGAAIYDGSGPGRCNCDIARNYPWAFGPRLGSAYQITPKTVFRAGFGIVYSGTASNNNAAGGLAGSTATTPSSSFGVPVTTLAQGIRSSGRRLGRVTIQAISRRSRQHGVTRTRTGVDGSHVEALADVEIGFQREITNNLVGFTYVGNRGVWWQKRGHAEPQREYAGTSEGVCLDVPIRPTRRAAPHMFSPQSRRDQDSLSRIPDEPNLAQGLRPSPIHTFDWNPMARPVRRLQAVTQRFSMA
jgi:hypothetical protein